jgi:hypothetical protein
MIPDFPTNPSRSVNACKFENIKCLFYVDCRNNIHLVRGGNDVVLKYDLIPTFIVDIHDKLVTNNFNKYYLFTECSKIFCETLLYFGAKTPIEYDFVLADNNIDPGYDLVDHDDFELVEKDPSNCRISFGTLSRLGRRLGRPRDLNKFKPERACSKQTTAKYTKRPSPPYPANLCRDSTMIGNDGSMYVSSRHKRNGQVYYRWTKA